jgi:uncharacterized protein YaeQ
MALKPTIYKLNATISDMNRGYYQTHQLTIALHPSETQERMVARIMAFCLNADEHLSFSRGLSANDEPDIWSHSLDGQTQKWIELGEPSVDRVKKASHIAKTVKVYSFNTKSDVWWRQSGAEFCPLKATYYRFSWDQIHALTALIDRTMTLSITISEESAYIAGDAGEFELSWITLDSESE